MPHHSFLCHHQKLIHQSLVKEITTSWCLQQEKVSNEGEKNIIPLIISLNCSYEISNLKVLISKKINNKNNLFGSKKKLRLKLKQGL